MSGFAIRDVEGNPVEPELFLRRLREGVYHKQALAKVRQENLTAALGERRHLKEAELLCSVDPVVYHHWRRRFSGQVDSEGNPINPWEHDDFLRDLQRDNEALRPRIAKKTNRVGYGDGSGLVRAGKYTRLKEAVS